jgi:hypothetical protein
VDAVVVLDTKIAGRLRVSVISEIELLSHDGLDESAESAIRAFLSMVEVVGLDPPIKEAAIALRREFGLTIPDAVIAATAATLNAELLSNDAKLANTPRLRSRPLPLREPSNPR